METHAYDLRRLLVEDELEDLEALQSGASFYNQHFPEHKSWIKKVLDQVRSGTRVAYGIYSPTGTLIACMVMKRKKYAHKVEIKGLYVDENIPDHEKKRYYDALLTEADTFAAKQGDSGVVTYTPWNEIELVKVLHRHNFYIQKVERSPYKKGEFLYTFTKDIKPYFVGDPYDTFSIARWFISEYHGFRVHSSNQETEPKIIDFTLQPHPQIGEIGLQDIDGRAYVFERRCDQNVCKAPGPHILMVFAPEIDNYEREVCRNHRVLVFNENIIYEQMSQFFTYPMPPFPKSDIRGMMVLIKEQYTVNISERSSFTYFKGGEVGKYLKRGHTLVIVSENRKSNSPQYSLVGIGKINDIFLGPPNNAWDRYKDTNPLLSGKKEFDKFAKEKNIVMAIVVSDFVRAADSCGNMLSIVIRDNIHSFGGNYRLGGAMSHMYLDEKGIDTIKKRCLKGNVNDRTSISRQDIHFDI